ncbi:hypothetical protein Ancab_023558 [Ancistrocladus abbreviatus]
MPTLSSRKPLAYDWSVADDLIKALFEFRHHPIPTDDITESCNNIWLLRLMNLCFDEVSWMELTYLIFFTVIGPVFYAYDCLNFYQLSRYFRTIIFKPYSVDGWHHHVPLPASRKPLFMSWYVVGLRKEIELDFLGSLIAKDDVCPVVLNPAMPEFLRVRQKLCRIWNVSQFCSRYLRGLLYCDMSHTKKITHINSNRKPTHSSCSKNPASSLQELVSANLSGKHRLAMG